MGATEGSSIEIRWAASSETKPASSKRIEGVDNTTSMDKLIDAPEEEPWLRTRGKTRQLGRKGKGTDNGIPLFTNRGKLD